ncbi:hypothetical protein ACWEK5_48965 [Rhodococcus koreensis]
MSANRCEFSTSRTRARSAFDNARGCALSRAEVSAGRIPGLSATHLAYQLVSGVHGTSWRAHDPSRRTRVHPDQRRQLGDRVIDHRPRLLPGVSTLLDESFSKSAGDHDPAPVDWNARGFDRLAVRPGRLIGDRQRIRDRVLDETEPAQMLTQTDDRGDEPGTGMMSDQGAGHPWACDNGRRRASETQPRPAR